MKYLSVSVSVCVSVYGRVREGAWKYFVCVCVCTFVRWMEGMIGYCTVLFISLYDCFVCLCCAL